MLQSLTYLFSSTRFVVRGDSMLPTLADRQAVLAVATCHRNDLLRRGDIVVLQPPDPNPELRGRTFIKRIVGLPNEDLRLHDGLVYVNGELLKETYLDQPSTPKRSTLHEWWMGPDEYFVMGDNREGSDRDSRHFGPVNRRLLLGKAWFRYWPPRAWGRVSEPRGFRGRD